LKKHTNEEIAKQNLSTKTLQSQLNSTNYLLSTVENRVDKINDCQWRLKNGQLWQLDYTTICHSDVKTPITKTNLNKHGSTTNK